MRGGGWRGLLPVIGDTLMMYLLQHSSMFVAIGGSSNGNYLQVCGRPIGEVGAP